MLPHAASSWAGDRGPALTREAEDVQGGEKGIGRVVIAERRDHERLQPWQSRDNRVLERKEFFAGSAGIKSGRMRTEFVGVGLSVLNCRAYKKSEYDS